MIGSMAHEVRAIMEGILGRKWNFLELPFSTMIVKWKHFSVPGNFRINDDGNVRRW